MLATHQQDYPKSLQYYVDLVPGHVVEPEPLVTLRPRNGVLVTLRRRTGVRV